MICGLLENGLFCGVRFLLLYLIAIFYCMNAFYSKIPLPFSMPFHDNTHRFNHNKYRRAKHP